MTFEDKLKAAGFKNRPAFARKFNLDYSTVRKWKDRPPYWAVWVCDGIIKQRKDAAAIIDILERARS